MIVCSCNVLTDRQILATLQNPDASRPRSPAQAYRCLGCAPRCGRCVATVRALLAQARNHACDVGCATCPGVPHDGHANDSEPPLMIAAE